LSELLTAHPDTDRTRLRTLVRAAQRDRERGRPEAQRKLFRFLREIQDAGPPDDSGDGPRDETEPRSE
jgi:ribosome-associated protein